MDFMDWDLWGSPYDPEESRFCSQSDRLCDFHFGYGFDVIEEDALNEKCCVQVLRILITQAETEIDELQQDLIALQSKLALIEDEEWSEICCDALRTKINCLDTSIKSLVNKDKNDVEVHLLMHTQPVETLHEILKDLLCNNLSKKYEQPNKTNGAVIVREGMKESSSATEDDAVNPSLKLQERKPNNPEIVKPANACVKNSNPSHKVAAGNSDEEILSSNSGPINAGKGEGRKRGFSPKDKGRIQNSASKSADKGRRSLKKINVQPTNGGVNNAISDASEHTDGNSNKKKSSNFDSSIESENEEQSSISSAELSLGSSMKLEVKHTDPSQKVKLANATVKGLGLSARRHSTGDFNEMKNLLSSDFKVSGNKEYCSRATGKSKTFSSSLNCEGKGNYPAKLEHAVAGELRCTTHVNGRKGFSDSGFDTFYNPDIKQKLCDFSLKVARTKTLKEPKLAATEKVVSLNSSLKAQGKKKSPRLIVKVGEAALTETESSALTSLLEQPDNKGKNAMKLQLKEEGKTIREVHTSETASDDKKSKSNLSQLVMTRSPNRTCPKEKVNRSMKSNPLILQEIGISTLVIDSSSSFLSKAKKRQKSLVGPVNRSLHQDCKVMRKVVQLGEFEPDKNSDSFDDCPKSVPQPHNKRKKSTEFPIIPEVGDFSLEMDFSGSHRNTTDSLNKDAPSLIESSSCDSVAEAAALLPSALDLQKKTLADLRAMAKQYKLTKYSKLTKKDLLIQLANRIDAC